METLVGRRLGKYQIETLVGRGGMAAVYRAHDTALNRSVAIKVLEPSLAIDPKAVERFRREAVTSANLEHPAIVRVFDVQQSGNIHFIAMRYVQGTTLRDILRHNGSLPLDAVINIIKPVASALHYAHRHGVIHRDVKPGNILVEPDGTVLLTDFGIARAADSTQSALTATGQVMGTADYLSPEQISGRPAEPRSDIYALGVVLYEMLTGVTPFAGETTASILYRQVHDTPVPIRSINPRLPSELQPIVDRALTKNPALRYSDPLDMVRELEEVSHWLPPGSPWIAGKPAQPASPASNGKGRNEAAAAQGARPPTQPNADPRPLHQAHSDKPYIEEISRPHRQVIAPQQVGRRSILALALALTLLAAGALMLAMAAGLIPTFGGDGQERARFEPPGPATYTGPLRKDNGPNIHVPKALAPPAIDGDLSDWAGSAPNPVLAPYVTFTAPESKWGGPSDLSAEFYFAWDRENFYVGAVITDDSHIQTSETQSYNLYNGDDVEMWFDTNLEGDFAISENNSDDYQLGMSPGNFANLGPEAVFWNPTPRSEERNKQVLVAAQPRLESNGYTIEAAVPWKAFGGFQPQPGRAIGFAASAGDSDRRVEPKQKVMISTAPRLRYQKPVTFGNLFF